MIDSLPASTAPTIDEVDRIARLQDPVLRNLQITQCYYELSKALTLRTGFNANWCTFATWASKQAGQSIRKEDLLRILERALQETTYDHQTVEDVALEARLSGAKRSLDEIRAAVRKALDLRSAVDRASEAVGRGNVKVFEEIGCVFAHFLSEFLHDTKPDLEKLRRFCDDLLPGEPPDGQRYLSQAFRRYYQSFFVEDPKTRAELVLCANIEIGLHEQTRLQPEIIEALDAAFVNATGFTRRLIAASFPLSGWLVISQWLGLRLLGRATTFDRAVQVLLAAAQLQMRQTITETIMSIRIPPALLVRLGDDLTAGFPEMLRQLADPDLCALLAQFDPTPDSLAESGALDWANLPDRLHFIIDLFRCYQEWRDLFEAPFTPQQVEALKAGRLPDGRL